MKPVVVCKAPKKIHCEFITMAAFLGRINICSALNSAKGPVGKFDLFCMLVISIQLPNEMIFILKGNAEI